MQFKQVITMVLLFLSANAAFADLVRNPNAFRAVISRPGGVSDAVGKVEIHDFEKGDRMFSVGIENDDGVNKISCNFNVVRVNSKEASVVVNMSVTKPGQAPVVMGAQQMTLTSGVQLMLINEGSCILEHNEFFFNR